MKKYISITIAVLCALALASCNKLLDYGREGVPTQDNYPLTDALAPYEDKMVKSRLDVYSQADGTRIGVPTHVGASVMYWNAEIFEKYGLDYKSVKTWDDYTKLGEQLKEASNGEVYLTSVDTGGTDWLWLAMSEYGEDWTGGMGGTANVQLESVKKMLTMQQDWLNSGLAEVSPDGHVDLEAGFQNILDGNIVSFPKAMWYMSRFINYMPEEKGNWYIAKCPVFEAGQKCSVGIGGTGTVVTNQSKDPELAADFVAYAKCSPDGDAHNTSNQYNTFFRNFPYDVLASIKDDIGKISVTKISPTINEQICTTTLNEVLEDGMDVDEALQEAQDAVDLEQQ